MNTLSLWDTAGQEMFDFKEIVIPIEQNNFGESFEQLLTKELSSMISGDTYTIGISDSNIITVKNKSSNKVIGALFLPPDHNSLMKKENNINSEDKLERAIKLQGKLEQTVVRLAVKFPIEHEISFNDEFTKIKDCCRKEQRLKRKELRERNPTQHQKRR